MFTAKLAAMAFASWQSLKDYKTIADAVLDNWFLLSSELMLDLLILLLLDSMDLDSRLATHCSFNHSQCPYTQHTH